MKAASATRAGVLAGILTLASMVAAPPAFAARNQSAEQHVAANANAALDALNGGSQANFRRVVTQMADVPRVAAYVLGRYGAQIRGNAQLQSQWIEAFEAYMLASYRSQLDRYAGSDIRVTGSTERVPGQDVVVRSEITAPGTGRVIQQQWRVLRSGSGWKVADVSFVMEGNEVWLAQQQQREFAGMLERNNGDISALIAEVRQNTSTMQRR